MVAVLSEWWLFYLSGGWCRPLPTTADHCGNIPEYGVMCSSCLPLGHGHCLYLSPEIDCPGIGSQTSSHDSNGLNDVADVSNSVTTLFN